MTGRTLGGVAAYRRRTGWTKGVCTWEGCRKPTPGRLLWCGDACVAEYAIRNDPGVARAHVFARDRGVCGQCGLDTEAVRRHVVALQDAACAAWSRVRDLERPIRFRAGQMLPDEAPPDRTPAREATRLYTTALIAARHDRRPPGNTEVDARMRHLGHLWEMDHIVPVVEGGGACGLDNLRTLCLSCHRAETAALAARRADRRRPPSVQVPLLGRGGR